MLDNIHDLLSKAGPGAVGSTAALFWIKGGILRRLGLWALGIAIAVTVGEWAAQASGVPETASGLVIGLFAMAIIDKIFDAIQSFDLASVFNRIIDRFLGGK